MRAIISAAIFVVAAGGVLMPIEADARVPSRVEKWGCIFEALGVRGPDTIDPRKPWDEFGLGSIRCPGGKQRLVVTVSVMQDMPDGPHRLVNREKVTGTYGRFEEWEFADGFQSWPDGRPALHPYFQHMRVRRVGQPGAIAVASENNAKPCGPWGGPRR